MFKVNYSVHVGFSTLFLPLFHTIFSMSLRWLRQNKILFGDNLGFVYSLELALVKEFFT